jgi:hypothetical protein
MARLLVPAHNLGLGNYRAQQGFYFDLFFPPACEFGRTFTRMTERLGVGAGAVIREKRYSGPEGDTEQRRYGGTDAAETPPSLSRETTFLRLMCVIVQRALQKNRDNSMVVYAAVPRVAAA